MRQRDAATLAFRCLSSRLSQVTDPPVLPCLLSPTLQLRGDALHRFRERHGHDANPVLDLASGPPAPSGPLGSSDGAVVLGSASVEAGAEIARQTDGDSQGGPAAAEGGGRVGSGVGQGPMGYHCDAELLAGWGSENRCGVRALAASFFRYYAALDPSTAPRVSVRAPRRLQAGCGGTNADVETGSMEAEAWVWVEDPLDPTYNVARHVCGASRRRVVAEFVRAHCLCAAAAPLRRVLQPARPPPTPRRRRRRLHPAPSPVKDSSGPEGGAREEVAGELREAEAFRGGAKHSERAPPAETASVLVHDAEFMHGFGAEVAGHGWHDFEELEREAATGKDMQAHGAGGGAGQAASSGCQWIRVDPSQLFQPGPPNGQDPSQFLPSAPPGPPVC